MAIITVTNNSNRGDGSLREAIATAESGDTIKFDSSLANQTITLNRFIGIGKSLTIDGSDAPGLTISGGEQTNIFRLGQENKNVTIRNLTLADSYYEATAGGAIWAQKNSTVNIENTNFINNVSQGAAVHGQDGTNITVINSTFDGNDGAKISNLGYSTGAISLFSFGSLTIQDSVFTNNKGLKGGALHVTASDLIIEDSVFTGNDSTPGVDKNFADVPGGGGAIYLDAASVPTDPRFTTRPEQGETESGVVSINNSHFENNRGARLGGAIMAWGYNQDRIIISDSEIINNEVIASPSGEAKGGGLWLMGFVEIDNTIIANNKSADLGGGLYLHGEVPAKISNSTFSGNQAVNGGAIYDARWASKIDIDNTNFDSNFATNKAGVFYSRDNRPVSFQNSQFTNNTPDDLNDVSFRSNVPDIGYGTNSSNNILGTEQNSYLVGLNGNDTIEGRSGNDYLDGGANNDILLGGEGNDTLIGGDSRNNLVGGEGNDIFLGGNGQDLMAGGSGQDRYIIGDQNNRFYTNQRWYDHAIIKDFQLSQDTIQLKGQASDYRIQSASSQGIVGTGIFYNNGMVALVGDINPSDFSLNATYIDYINSGVSINDRQVELTSDSLFSGQPNYNAAEHDGLFVWNIGDTWYVEATGDSNGSRFTGRIIADSPIEGLDGQSLESNDRVNFVDNSNQILEFNLNVGNRWKDGFSFKVADGASPFLDLDDNNDISVKAGVGLEEVNT